MKKIFKIISSIISIALLISIFPTLSKLGVFDKKPSGSNPDSSNPGENFPEDWDTKLTAPINLTYDGTTYILSWEDPNTEGVGKYKIYINGTLHKEVDNVDTEEKITLTTKETKFQVQAVAGDVFHRDSDLSAEYIYNMPDELEQTVFNKVNKRVAKDLEINGYNKFEILGISSLEEYENKNGADFKIEVIGEKNGTAERIMVYYSIDKPIMLDDVLNEIDIANYLGERIYSLVDYKTADKYLKRDIYDGKMQKLREQGYTFTTVDSAICKGNGDTSYYEYDFVATYKAERGSEVIYITTRNNVYTEGDARERFYYESYITNSTLSTVREKSSVIYTDGAMMDFITELLKTKNPAA